MELREFLFAPLAGQLLPFAITARQGGVFSGATRLKELAATLELETVWIAAEGTPVDRGSCIFRARGKAEAIVRAEEMLLGVIGKPSGVATAAAKLIREAGGRVRIVCGAWKKVAPEIRRELRQAIATGGAGIRITDQPFIYLDKNYVRLLGGVEPAVKRARAYDPERVIAVQIRGEIQPVAEEALAAAQAGAGILMVDTGRLADLAAVAAAVRGNGGRGKMLLAYAGGVTPADVQAVVDAGADIVDVGRAIIDAPLLDFSLDVIAGSWNPEGG